MFFTILLWDYKLYSLQCCHNVGVYKPGLFLPKLFCCVNLDQRCLRQVLEKIFWVFIMRNRASFQARLRTCDPDIISEYFETYIHTFVSAFKICSKYFQNKSYYSQTPHITRCTLRLPPVLHEVVATMRTRALPGMQCQRLTLHIIDLEVK